MFNLSFMISVEVWQSVCHKVLNCTTCTSQQRHNQKHASLKKAETTEIKNCVFPRKLNI